MYVRTRNVSLVSTGFPFLASFTYSALVIRSPSLHLHAHVVLSILAMKKKVLKIGQINVGKRLAFADMIARAFELKYDLLAICELPKNYLPACRDFELLSTDSAPRVAILKLNRTLQLISLVVEKDLVIAKIKYLNITVASAYIPPENTTVSQAMLGRLSSYMDDNPDRALLLGDLNARISGGGHYHRISNKFQEAAEKAMWILLNPPGVPTFKTSGTDIDWSLVTQDIAEKADWDIEMDPILDMSDHIFIRLLVRTTRLIATIRHREILPTGPFTRSIIDLESTLR